MGIVSDFSEAIAGPMDNVSSELKALSQIHRTANNNLQKQAQELTKSFEGLGGSEFITMIGKQHNYAEGICKGIDEIAGYIHTGAGWVRDAAHTADSLLQPFMDLAGRVIHKLTPNLVIKHGDDAVRVIINDMRKTVHDMAHSGSSFFSDVFHLRLGDAVNDAEQEAKDLARLAGDALAMLGQLEPILVQWASAVFQANNWLNNQINSVLYGIIDWVFGFSDIANNMAILSDPNATDEEKALAGTLIGVTVIMDILMFIPGVDILDLIGKGLLKVGIDFALKEFVDNLIKKAVSTIVEKVLGNIIKDLIDKTIQKLSTTYGKIIAEQMVKKELESGLLNGLKGDLEKSLSAQFEQILRDYLAKKITLKEALARINLTKDIAKIVGDDLISNKITQDEAKRKLAALPQLMEKYDPDTVKAILQANDMKGSQDLAKTYERPDGTSSRPAHAYNDHVDATDQDLIDNVTKSSRQGGKGSDTKFFSPDVAEEAVNDAIAKDPELKKFITDPASRNGNTILKTVTLDRDLGYGYEKVVNKKGVISPNPKKLTNLRSVTVQLGVDSQGHVFIFTAYPSP